MDPDGNLVEFYSMQDSGIQKAATGLDTASPTATLPAFSTEEKPRRSRK